MQKVAIITGASSGIGLATAKLLIENNYIVYGIARSKYSGNDFECFQADVNDSALIKEIFEKVFAKHQRIDVVINNAGMGIAGAVEHASIQRIEQIFNTNLTSLVKIASLSIDYLKKSQGNLINLSSVAGILPIPFQACYSATKAGVYNFSLALDGELRRFNVKVTAILPGDTKTGFTRNRITEGGKGDYKGSIEKSIKRMEKDEQSGKGPEVVANAILKCLKKKKPPLKYTVGLNYKFFVWLEKVLPVRLVNFILRKMYG